MAMKLDSMQDGPKTLIEGKWYYAKGCIKPFIWRLKDAWGVLTGRYEAHAYECEERKRVKT